MQYLCRKKILEVFFDRRYAVSNINIVGLRDKNYSEDNFQDLLTVFWFLDGTWHERTWPITTRPGKPYFQNPINPKGTAILVPGQYQNSHSLGQYKGNLVLKQVEPVSVYRDNNRDSAPDENNATIETGIFGIHIHPAGFFSRYVGISSAGCQVFQQKNHFTEFISICEQAALMWGNKFTYTLLEL